MRVNTIQNTSYNRVNFGCNYCEATKVLLESNGIKGAEKMIDEMIQKYPVIVLMCKDYERHGIGPDEFHRMEARAVLTAFSEGVNLQELKKQPTEIVEGVFAKIVDVFLDKITEFVKR